MQYRTSSSIVPTLTGTTDQQCLGGKGHLPTCHCLRSFYNMRVTMLALPQSTLTPHCQACEGTPFERVVPGTQGNVEQLVAAAAQRILGFVPNARQPLMEAGLDSLGAVELRNDLTARLQIELPATMTLDYPSIAAVATFIAPLLVATTTAGPPASPSASTISDFLSVSFRPHGILRSFLGPLTCENLCRCLSAIFGTEGAVHTQLCRTHGFPVLCITHRWTSETLNAKL